jgi:hypothetical protein
MKKTTTIIAALLALTSCDKSYWKDWRLLVPVSPTPTPTPREQWTAHEPTEETEELNEWSDTSPDKTWLAVTRVIPDLIYIQRHNLDGVAVAIFRLGEEGPAPVARHDFHGLIIARIEWSPDSRFLLFTTTTASGHSAFHTPAFLYCVADNTFRGVDTAIGIVTSPEFRFEPPDIAIMEVKKGEADEEEVKVSLAKTMEQMPSVK